MKTFLKIFALIVINCSAALAEPETLVHQGLLTSPSGTPLDTVVSVTFKLYNDADSPTPFWSEVQSVTVANGLYNVALGTVTAFPADFLNDGTTWLGITVGEDAEMLPRSKLRSVPFAFRVRTVDDASGGDISSDVLIRGKLNVGLFNSNPAASSNVIGSHSDAEGYSSFVAGSYSSASGDHAVCLGHDNHAPGYHATVSGGRFNTASGDFSVIAGGGDNDTLDGNNAEGTLTTIGGGYHNNATGDASTIAGGYYHTASGGSATIGGGYRNTSTASYSSVGGGTYNDATGTYSTVPGGSHNLAEGSYSFAAGRRAKAHMSGSFRWADGTNADFDGGEIADTIANTFAVRASGGVYIYTSANLLNGAVLYPGGSAWYTLSDSTIKRRCGVVNAGEVLRKIEQLPIERWSYKTQDENIQHIGPMAQDFWSAFHVGDDSLSISTIDPSGVALAAIQELAKQNRDMQNEIILLRSQLQTIIAGQTKASLENNHASTR